MKRFKKCAVTAFGAASSLLLMSGNLPNFAHCWLSQIAWIERCCPLYVHVSSTCPYPPPRSYSGYYYEGYSGYQGAPPYSQQNPAQLPSQTPRYSLVAFQSPQPTPIQSAPSSSSEGQVIAYQPKDYSYLLGMPGFSDKALQQHFTLYKGYVNNVNQLIQTLADMDAKGQQKSQAWSELRRRLGWEWDGMRLHELYFDNLGGSQPIDPHSALSQAIKEDFGNQSNWEQDFKATGAMRGIGWAILYQDPATGHLFNVWIDEHDNGHLTMGTPLLVMDVWEHAYMTDYGINRADYINAFFNNINWPVVQERYDQANPQK